MHIYIINFICINIGVIMKLYFVLNLLLISSFYTTASDTVKNWGDLPHRSSRTEQTQPIRRPDAPRYQPKGHREQQERTDVRQQGLPQRHYNRHPVDPFAPKTSTLNIAGIGKVPYFAPSQNPFGTQTFCGLTRQPQEVDPEIAAACARDIVDVLATQES